MDLFWMIVSKKYPEEDGALMPDLVCKIGLAARIGEETYYEVWPSEPPEHIDDGATLTIKSEGGFEELGRFSTGQEAAAAAQRHYNGIMEGG
ncbi:hypothetical protein [Mycobacterium intracellulare]|uniref:hypothetical protein n=1 Tax=Mycobacterium intracellulare TaxID=1767 RepID=UPI0035DFFE7B|nr:hypothetical protein KN247_26490 [Mycobacterium intracellulare]